jgi:hypothetical protein
MTQICMSTMNRRTFMLSGAALATVAGSAWPWFAQAAGSAREARAFAIVDSMLCCADALARYAARVGLPVFETGGDVGTLWFAQLAPLLDSAAVTAAAPAARLARPRASLLGITRASDYFVLRHLALCAGRFSEHCHEQRAASGARVEYVAFALTPRNGRHD